MTSFNVSEWALKHRSFVWFLMLVCCIAGVLAYRSLGREEDPKFTIKTMIVQQRWPGATVHDMIDQVTERIEKELKQIDALDYTKSYTTPGQTTVFVNLKDSTNVKDVPWLFYQVRKHVEDIQYAMPSGIQQPAFNDEFGDVYGNIYGFTADGISQRQLRDYVEQVRSEVLSVPSIGKVQVIGAQDEVIYLDISIQKLAGARPQRPIADRPHSRTRMRCSLRASSRPAPSRFHCASADNSPPRRASGRSISA